MSSIYYIEDIDSLRFALSIYDEFSIKKLQPHFPGYPLFCLLGNIIYTLTGSLANTFSIIGGISTYIIIYFSIKLTGFKKYSWVFYSIIFLILTNPIILIMSNRYMPDLFGLSIFIASFYMLTNKKVKYINFGSFLFGLMLGVRLSYFPLLIIPYFILIAQNNYRITMMIIMNFLFGCLIWLIPMIWITGVQEFIQSAQNQTIGHFTDFGGTMLTESSWINRLKYFIHTIWSDGLGGYWLGRSYFTICISICMIPLILSSFQWMSKNLSKNKKIKILIASVLLYSIWALSFQNIIYKSRHIMPIVYLIVILFSYGQSYSFRYKKYLKVIFVVFIFLLSTLSFNIAQQHINKTAISKSRDYFVNSDNSTSILSNPLINYYLSSTGIVTNFINIEGYSNPLKKNKSNNIYMIGDYHSSIDSNYTITLDTTFYHNPYVNRMWSTIKIYSLKLNE